MSDEKDIRTEKSGDLPSTSMTVEEGQKSIGTEDSEPKPPISAIGLHYLREGQVPSRGESHTNIEKNRKYSKILMLGNSGAGKTTLLKSMIFCCEDSYGPVEREIFKEGIYKNLIEDIQTIFDVMKTFDIEVASKESHDHFRTVMKVKFSQPSELPVNVALAIKALWDDSGVRAGFRKSSNCRLNDSCGYFFENFDRITSFDYLPTNQDVLRYRFKTIGIFKKDLLSGNSAYSIWDVGGMRKQRRKWIHCLQNLDIIIFSVDISAYDLGVFEDDKINVMQEDLQLMGSICGSRWLRQTVVLVCFNKVDSLQRKLAYRPFDDYFEDFDSDRLNLDDVMAYIERKFLSVNQFKPKDMIQVCFTEMTDDKNLGQAAFAALRTCVKIKEFYDSKEEKATQATGCIQPLRFTQCLVSRFRR